MPCTGSRSRGGRGAEAVARLAPGKQLAEIDILVELQADDILAKPDDGSRDLLRRQLDVDVLPDLRGIGDDRRKPPAERFLTLTSCCSPEASVTLAMRSIADTRSSVAAFGRPRN